MSFPATRLSVVERTRSGDEETRRVALATIIEAYWKPVYKYLRVKWSLGPEEAADLTQEFFATALEKDVIVKYQPDRARFRTYLRLCVDGFAGNVRKAERRLKRGGGVTLVPLDFETAEGEIRSHEPAVTADVDELFYREWVRALMERSVADLKRAAEDAGRPVMFDVFARYDLNDQSETRPTYAEIAQTLVTIEFIESLGDWKTAWDHVHFRGFLGTPMTLQFTWQGCDSLLAAPLVLDLVRFAELAHRRGERGLLTFLASFFKSPLGVTEHDFVRQLQMLEAWADKARS